MNIHIFNGEAQALGECELFDGEGVVGTERYSHIWPANPLKRLAFRVMRRLTGERGAVSDWTRRWRGRWTVRLASEPDVVRFEGTREACVAWESKHLDGTL